MSDVEYSNLQHTGEAESRHNDDKPRDFFAEHEYLFLSIGLEDADDFLIDVFETVSGLCDPYTQPEDNDINPLSVACLADLAVAITYQQLLVYRAEEGKKDTPSIHSLRFTLSLNFFKILNAISRALRADDPVRISALHNDQLYWELRDPFWLPIFSELEENELKLCYYMSCVLIYAIYRLFAPEDGSPYNLALNPYTDYFFRLWKSHSGILRLAFELDHDLEEFAYLNSDEYFDVPENVKRALLGSSAVRAVLAYILNQTTTGTVYTQGVLEDRKSHEYDVCQQPLLDFYDPLARKKPNSGAITADHSAFIYAQLILRSFMPKIRPLRDAFQEVLRSEKHEAQLKEYMENREEYRSQKDYSYHFRRDLIDNDFLDGEIKYVFFGYVDSEDEDEDSEPNSAETKNEAPMALRSDPEANGVDEEGIDWSDCARGDNVKFTDAFLQLCKERSPCLSMEEFSCLIDRAMRNNKGETFGEHIDMALGVYFTIAKCIKDEAEEGVEPTIDPGAIYEYIVSPPLDPSQYELPINHPEVLDRQPTRFEYILAHNRDIAAGMIDEILMCNGFRRTFIWFITHAVNYSPILLNYIYELAMGLRGDTGALTYFSRVGKLELSPIERLMLLHEFFNNFTRWITQYAEQSRARALALVQFTCVMIRRLIENKIISTDRESLFINNHREEIETFLMPYIGDVLEARELYFEFRGGIGKTQNERQVWKQLLSNKYRDNEEILNVLLNVSFEDLALLDQEINGIQNTRLMSVLTSVNHFSRLCHGFEPLRLTTQDRPPNQHMVPDFRLYLKYYNILCHFQFVGSLASYAEYHNYTEQRGLFDKTTPFGQAAKDEQKAVENDNSEADEEHPSQQENSKKKRNKKKKKGKKR